MAFKSVKAYNEERFGNFFILRDDGDFADVIFLYESLDDVLVANAHYIKSDEYSGYVHCCGHGCPACEKGISVQNKLFIPVYNVKTGEILFFDRSMSFEPQLERDVFSKFANPSEYVFRIIRHGAYRDRNTTYEIVVLSKVSGTSYGQLLAEKGITFPEYYNMVCRDLSVEQLRKMLNNSTGNTSAGDLPTYNVSPRPVVSVPVVPTVPVTPVSSGVPEFNSPIAFTYNSELDTSVDSTESNEFTEVELDDTDVEF